MSSQTKATPAPSPIPAFSRVAVDPAGVAPTREAPGPDPTAFVMVHQLGRDRRHVAAMVDAMTCAIANVLEAKCPCWSCSGLLRGGVCDSCGCYWSVATSGSRRGAHRFDVRDGE